MNNPFEKKSVSWKWTSGEVYARSKRRPPAQTCDNGIDLNFSEEQEKAAYTTALNHNEDTWDILNQTAVFRNTNKREDMDFKIADRDMMQQRGFNPFNPGSNYANDLAKYTAPSAGR